MRVPALVQAAAGLALVALSACQDPSTVGLGLIDEDSPSPNVRVLTAATVDTVKYDLVTSGLADGSTPTQTRVLVGNVRDALYGDAASTAYVDALRPTLPDGFDDRPITRVTLELRREYVYGDTTAAFPIELRQVQGAWSPTGLPPDTTLGTGDLLTTTTVSGTDSTVVFTLPAAWVAANDSLFSSSSFSSSFEGFELRPVVAAGAGAVFGFTATASNRIVSRRSVIRVATARDTVAFPLSEVFSRITSGTPGLAPMGRRLVRAGSGTGIKLTFGFNDVLRLPLSQAVLRLPLDASLAGTDGTFKRPLARLATVFARPATGAPQYLTNLRPAASSADLRTTVPAQLTQLVQGILLGQATFRQFEVRFTDVLQTAAVSLDVLPVITDGSTPTTQPRLSLTVVSADA
ncbi:MAG TPA: hypothetical protein VF594_09010 [Rubricoccaceae bacterium]